jgi:hypothetical protein
MPIGVRLNERPISQLARGSRLSPENRDAAVAVQVDYRVHGGDLADIPRVSARSAALDR